MNILFIVDRDFPTKHAFIETVYSKIFPSENIKVYFLFKSNLNNKRYIEITKWNRAFLLLINTFGKKGIFYTFILNLEVLFVVFSLQRKIKFDIYQVRNWVWGGVLAFFFSKLNNSKFVFQHSFPREILLRERIKHDRFDRRVRAFFELKVLKFIWRKSDAIFAISEEMKRVLTKEERVKKEKIFPVGLGFEPDFLFDENIKKSILKKYDLLNKKVILYFGVMDKKRNLGFLISVFKRVLNICQEKTLRLVMVGGTNKEINDLKKVVIKENLEQFVIFTGYVNREFIKYFLKIAILSVSPIPPIPLYTVSSVTKVYESLGYGCPVVGNDLPEQGEVLRKSGGGLCVEYDVSQFSEAICKIIHDEKLREQMSNNGTKFVLENRTYKKIFEKVYNSYKEILNNGKQ